MADLNATELAAKLGVSKGRVSQWVGEGKLHGCYSGDGRSRRFSLERVALALGRNLDVVQALGNGRRTLAAIAPDSVDVDDEDDDDADGLTNGTKARYDTARTMLTEERARAARYENEQRAQSLVLASEVERQIAAQIGQEIAGFESVLRQAAKSVADKFKLDARAVRAEMMIAWRTYRGERAVAADTRVSGAKRSPAEKAADF